MPSFRCRKGSQIVEATMVLPTTILIIAALIGIIMTFYFNLVDQVEYHAEKRDQMYAEKEVNQLRIADSIFDNTGEASAQ
jgi:hypothetical protein